MPFKLRSAHAASFVPAPRDALQLAWQLLCPAAPAHHALPHTQPANRCRRRYPSPCRREGFSTDFGIVDIDFKDPKLPRVPKQSAKWLQKHVFSRSAKQ